jgi:steroid 5-alpha reductase family enzyme
MFATIAARVAEAWALAAALQLVLWGVQQRTHNAGIVDVGWGVSFVLVVVLFAVRATAPAAAWAPIAVVAAAWSVRLGGYLIARGAASPPEDGRYGDLRQRWAPRAASRFFVFFQAQALLAGLLATAFAVPFVASPWDSGWLRGLGVAIAGGGVVGEALADAQLARWKRDPANHGRVCDIGLWRYSRHPNYFFEWCVWLGYAVYGLAFAGDGGWIALAGQAVMLGSILKVTGIPATEAQALRSKGDRYRRYQETTSAFVPLPRRKNHGTSTPIGPGEPP